MEALGYDVTDAKRFLGVSFFDIVAPGAHGDAAAMMGRGARQPLGIHASRLDVRRKDGTAVTLDIHASPLWQDRKVATRVGVARIVDRGRESTDAGVIERAVLEERERIAHALRDRLAEVFEDIAHHASPAATVTDAKGSSPAHVLRRHGLDETDLAILRLVTRGASNPEIGRQVHLSAAAVKDRIGRLMRRLGATRRAELSVQALRTGIG